MELSVSSRSSSLKWWLELALLFGAICLMLLIKGKRFKRFRLTNKFGFNKRITQTLVLFFGVMLSTSLVFVLIAPEAMFDLPVHWPQAWLLLLVLYPLFSAIPQELIFRTFFFHRYKRIIPRKKHRVWLSATSFGFAHIIYGNWVAVILAMLAGYCFGQTYAASRSTLLVAFEHSLWGVWIFTLGIGQYFDLSRLAIAH
ncbi:CPBP family intramembrane glutamic endopeptidase [Colwellia sp. MEBiC06753]